MKRANWLWLAAMVCGSLAMGADGVKADVDWPEFMARNDMVWNRTPKHWHEGAFMGNGLLGAMLYAPDGEGLGWRLGRTDVVDRTNRIPIGWFHLRFPTEPTSTSMRVHLYDAEITGEAVFPNGSLRWRTFTHTEKPLIVVEIDADPGVVWSWDWQREEPIDPRKLYKKEKVTRHNPEATEANKGGISYCHQPLADGPGHTTAWKRIKRAHGETIFATIIRSDKPDTSLTDALTTLAPLDASAVPALRQSHREWWHAYYQKSFISLPDQRLEGFWWVQMYKLASGTRADRPMLDLMGPWFRETPWAKIWWNLNVQLTYWPVYTANHLGIGESLCRTLDNGLPNLIQNVPKEWQYDSAGIGRATSYDCRGRVGAEKGNLMWSCHNYWLQTRYAGDAKRRRTKLFPLLKRAVAYHMHLLQQGDDGRLHLPKTISPEYGEAPDCNYDLAMLRWGCQTLESICQEADMDDPQRPRWRKVLAKLVDFPANEDGWLIGRGVPMTMGHRHFSHLMMFYPLHLVTWDQTDKRDLIRKSVEHWLGFTSGKTGYTYTGAAAMYLRMGEPDTALKYLNTGLNRYVKPNTMYLEAGPVIETPLSAASVINDMLLQSWGDRVRVFPGVPSSWRTAAFHDLRAEGAFLVSAALADGKPTFVQIRAEKGGVCRLVSPFGDATVRFLPSGSQSEFNGEAGRILDLKLAKGATAILTPAGTSPALTVAPVATYTANAGYRYGNPPPIPEHQFAFAPALSGVRYVRVELPGEKHTLSLAEVQVMVGGKNIAQGAKASQSTTAYGGVAERAVDGNCSGMWKENTVTHTVIDRPNPWWEVDLGKPVAVQAVRLFNRTDACPERLLGFVVKLLDADRKILATRQAGDR
jgi:hypothetical protein